MAIVVYECERGRKCVYKLTYTNACITQMKMQKGGLGRNIRKAVNISIGTVTYMSIIFLEKAERKQKGGYEYRTEHKTCSARNTDRKTGREESIHTRHRLVDYRQTDKGCA